MAEFGSRADGHCTDQSRPAANAVHAPARYRSEVQAVFVGTLVQPAPVPILSHDSFCVGKDSSYRPARELWPNNASRISSESG
jgi:hypothetical protein